MSALREMAEAIRGVDVPGQAEEEGRVHGAAGPEVDDVVHAHGVAPGAEDGAGKNDRNIPRTGRFARMLDFQAALDALGARRKARAAIKAVFPWEDQRMRHLEHRLTDGDTGPEAAALALSIMVDLFDDDAVRPLIKRLRGLIIEGEGVVTLDCDGQLIGENGEPLGRQPEYRQPLLALSPTGPQVRQLKLEPRPAAADDLHVDLEAAGFQSVGLGLSGQKPDDQVPADAGR